MKNIVILGATGSIGTQTLDVVRRLPDQLRVVGLSAYKNLDLLRSQAAEFNVPESRLAYGENGNLVNLATQPNADLIVVAIAGAVGTEATLAALEHGKDVALATKEVLVAAGQIVTAAAAKSGAKILPIDSEHSAVFQCLQGSQKESLSRIWLTASGGPFREWSKEEIQNATLQDALNHPTWPSMGQKITIDSATLMNKGLETIEAHWLFEIPIDRIEVIIHPQSIVHSLVEFADSAILAQLGLPDMRLPIEYALMYPRRIDAGLPKMNVTELSNLTFAKPDRDRFPSLDLANRAGAVAGSLPAVLNAANEAAVSLFLAKQITFLAIMTLVERVMDAHTPFEQPTLDQITQSDTWARIKVNTLFAQDSSLHWKEYSSALN